MESPQEIDMDTVPPIPLCVHEIHTRMTMGVGHGPGVKNVVSHVTFVGHDEHGADIAVDGCLPGPLMAELSTRLQEYQVAANLEGMGRRHPRLLRRLKAIVLDVYANGGQVHEH